MNNTGSVTTTDPPIKYCLGVSASPLKYWIALDKVNELGLSKNIKENKNSFHAIIKTYKATEAIAGKLKGIIILIIIIIGHSVARNIVRNCMNDCTPWASLAWRGVAAE